MDVKEESRKRPLDSDGDSGFTKRSNQGNLDPLTREDVHMKILVPSCAAGAVIGKGGETIGRLQRETGAKIKMSKTHDTFPGTSERVCLVVGTVESCADVHREVAGLVQDKPDPHPRPGSDGDHKVNYERHKQTKILIPNSTAGVIIGKAGSYIREIKEKSGAHVNVSPKNDNPERIVTVSGETDDIRAAMMIVLEKLAGDPQSSSYPSIHYSEMHSGRLATPSSSMGHLSNSGGMNFNTGSMTPQQVQAAAQSLSSMMRNFSNIGSGMNNLSLRQRTMSPVLEQLVQTLRLTGYSDTAAEEIALALATLANYGVLGLASGGPLGNLMNMNRMSVSSNGSGMSQSAGLKPDAQSASSLLGNPPRSGDTLMGNLSGAGLEDDGQSTNLLRQLTQSLARTQSKELNSDVFGPVGTTKSSNNNISSLFGGSSLFSGGLGTSDEGVFRAGETSGSPEPHETQEIEVAENLAGAVIGQGGRGISEIQNRTGASVNVSKRGVYAPGTTNRIVTVKGPSSSVSCASAMVRQCIQDAESRRAPSAY